MKEIHLKSKNGNNPTVKKYVQAAQGKQHVVPKGNDWQVKKSGSQRAAKTFTTQKEAISYAREVAKRQQAELFVHGRDGRIRERNSYGHDPFPPRG